MKIITAPNEPEIRSREQKTKILNNVIHSSKCKIFLAGTIDSGNSKNWQKEVAELCKSLDNILDKILIFNPRRDVWPKDSDHKEVEKQIKWELNRLDESDIIIMNILPDSKSPISLMELGLYARSGKLIVFCTPEFYRYDNVNMVCQKYKIPLFHNNDPYCIYLTIKDWL